MVTLLMSFRKNRARRWFRRQREAGNRAWNQCSWDTVVCQPSFRWSGSRIRVGCPRKG